MSLSSFCAHGLSERQDLQAERNCRGQRELTGFGIVGLKGVWYGNQHLGEVRSGSLHHCSFRPVTLGSQPLHKNKEAIGAGVGASHWASPQKAISVSTRNWPFQTPAKGLLCCLQRGKHLPNMPG